MVADDFAKGNVLKQEAYHFSRYLIDRTPNEALVDGYTNANRKLSIDVPLQADKNVLDFALKHPWTISLLDAATGFIYPDALLRKKIYTMAAVLEAFPEYTEYFLPESNSTMMLLFRLIVNAFTAAIKIVIGIPLLMFIRRNTSD